MKIPYQVILHINCFFALYCKNTKLHFLKNPLLKNFHFFNSPLLKSKITWKRSLLWDFFRPLLPQEHCALRNHAETREWASASLIYNYNILEMDDICVFLEMHNMERLRYFHLCSFHLVQFVRFLCNVFSICSFAPLLQHKYEYLGELFHLYKIRICFSFFIIVRLTYKS